MPAKTTPVVRLKIAEDRHYVWNRIGFADAESAQLAAERGVLKKLGQSFRRGSFPTGILPSFVYACFDSGVAVEFPVPDDWPPPKKGFH